MGAEWFRQNWMYAGLIAGLFLLAIMPVVAGAWTLPLALVFLQLPLYMLHQLEEHAGDRFRTYVNTRVAGVPDALTTEAVVVINVPLVWGVDLAVLYLARFVATGLGLIAIYLSVVNAVAHILMAIRFRGYNPGLATAIVLFLPVGIWSLVVLSRAPGVTLGDHVLGLAVAVIVHIGIAVHVFRRTRAFRPS
jgi:Protein of unknown function with HXXEE motif